MFFKVKYSKFYLRTVNFDSQYPAGGTDFDVIIRIRSQDNREFQILEVGCNLG